MNLIEQIRVIEDYPKEGISFKDITTLLKNPEALQLALDQMIELADNYDFDYVIAPEARGFVLGTPIAYVMNKGMIPVRKPGKLPSDVLRFGYELEYGMDFLEMHADALSPGDRVIIVDDLLATGGTSLAMINMVEEMGASVQACIYLIELDFLNGREKLKGHPVHTVVHYQE